METLNLNVNLENLTAEEREALMKLVEKSNEKKSKVWKPTLGERFYVISSYGVLDCRTWYDDAFCTNLFEIGNVFPTLDAAEEELTRRKMLTKWKRLSIEAGEGENEWNGKNDHWIISYSYAFSELKTLRVVFRKYSEVCFPTKKSLLAAIEEIGEDNVKRYILGVRD